MTKQGLPAEWRAAPQTIDKPYIQERMQGFLYERRNSNEATSLLMF